MSLAMLAAPFDNTNESNINSDNLINQKRRTHNRTYKKLPKENFDTIKVNTFLDKIHNTDDDDDDSNNFFKPPPKAESVGVHRTIPEKHESTPQINMASINDSMFRALGRAPQPNYDSADNLDLNDYTNYGDNKSNEEYYKRVIPGHVAQNVRNQVNKPYYNNANTNNSVQEYQTPDVLLQKINYMISLLEDQQDEKTNNVTEEVVLYSFLGIFIIFVADTFVRAGKYVR